ncbi:hypothetical protein DFH09DRAFT_1307544 [Mycena vulgaris]|nr:hypothetical protein DFH09DRAFT_1307544 [Mycena vulgaris]
MPPFPRLSLLRIALDYFAAMAADILNVLSPFLIPEIPRWHVASHACQSFHSLPYRSRLLHSMHGEAVEAFPKENDVSRPFSAFFLSPGVILEHAGVHFTCQSRL